MFKILIKINKNIYITTSKSIYALIIISYEHNFSIIKFHNAFEASLKIELLIHKTLKNYYIVKWLLDWVENESEKLEIDEAKEFLDELCHEIREIMNNQTQELQKGES